MSVNASVQIVVHGLKTKTQVPVVVKTNHVILMNVQYPTMMKIMSCLMVLQRNRITNKIFGNQIVVAVQLQVSIVAILDT